jgi:cholesterol transport system auxiliary component
MKLARCAATMLAAALLGACSGGLFQTKVAPPTLYMLSAGPSVAGVGAPAADIAGDLAILKPRVRAGLDTDRIAALYPDHRLDYFADARWSGPLDAVMQDLVVQVFHSRGGMRNVSGDVSAFSSAFWLESEITDFQAEYSSAGGAPAVHVHLIARIGSSTERRIIARFEADAAVPASENRMRAIVEAYNKAADQALSQIAASTAQALAGVSKAP